MKLRTATIWITWLTTWLLLLATIIIPCVGLFNIFFGLLIWFFTGMGMPLVVSLVIVHKLKFGIPAFILFLSTLIYGIWFWYVCDAQYQLFSAPTSSFILPYITVGSIFFMPPLWYLSWKINHVMLKK